MNYSMRVVSKLGTVMRERVAQSPLSWLAANKIKGNYILMYHGVTADNMTVFNRRHLSFQYFSRHIAFLKKHFQIISLADYFAGNYDYSKSNFVLTFDDGFLNNYIYAKPILEQFKVPATFFITGLNDIGDNILWADYLNIASIYVSKDVVIDGEVFKKTNDTYYSADTGKSLYDIIRYERTDYGYKLKVKVAFDAFDYLKDEKLQEYWKLMSDEQIQELARSPLLSIGSHGYFHNNLGGVPHADALSELAKSKEYLENLTQQKIDKLAYPDGSYTLGLMEDAHNMGFAVQLAADVPRCDESPRNEYIQRRRGIYAVGTCMNQLFNAVGNVA